MECGDDREEFWGASDLLKDVKEPDLAHQVKGFDKVHESEEQWLLLLSTILLQLTEGVDHVCWEPPGSEATL